jgi:membrane protein implicated in regulation of membrane protease activity
LAWGCCEILLLLVFIIFLGFFSTWLLLAMTSAQLISATSSFLPIWTFARVTEIFYWGTAWAFLVQYGASESAKRTRMRQREREKKRERERQRRARLLDPQQPWWRRGWNLIWPWNRETRHEEVI